MKCKAQHLLTLLLLILSGVINSQTIFEEPDRVFGLDPLLYNGTKYTYFLPSGTGGHQFLSSRDFVTGEVVIKGKTFSDLQLNYDIYNQELLLKYTDDVGAENIIALSKAWLESFNLDDQKYVCLEDAGGFKFYRVAGSGDIKFLIYWKKKFKLESGTVQAKYSFSEPERDIYLSVKDEMNPVQSKKSIIQLFNPEYKSPIKSYLREYRIRIKKSPIGDLEGLANYLSSLTK